MRFAASAALADEVKKGLEIWQLNAKPMDVKALLRNGTR